jgi:hypothetical protein
MDEPKRTRGAVADETRFEATIVWPTDIYRDADVSNYFVLSDDGQALYLGFGHIPPIPAPPPEGPVTVVPTVRGAVYLTYKNAAELAQLLGQFMQRKQEEPGDGKKP